MNDIVLNKKESIERCIRQIKRYYAMDSDVSFEEDYLKQDAIAIKILPLRPDGRSGKILI